MSKSKEPSEADIVFNRANVALAKHQRLVASWLPARTDTDLTSSKTQEELDREEEEMFAPVPELLGVGATVPKDKNGLPRKSEASALDKLRTQLLGKKGIAAPTPSKPIGSKPLAPPIEKSDQHIREDSDEEQGRAGAITNGRKPKTIAPDKKTAKFMLSEQDTGGNSKEIEFSEAPREQKREKSKRPSNFMDELLQRKGKKNKR